MKSILFVIRHPVAILMIAAALVSGGVLVVSRMKPDVYPLNTPQARVYLTSIDASAKQARGYIAERLKAYFQEPAEESEEEEQTIVVTSPEAKDVVITQKYVCQIHSRRHIEVRALEEGYLEEIKVKEGQAVKEGDILFTVIPYLYQAKLDAKRAEARLAEIEYDNTKNLFEKKVVSKAELALQQAKLDRAKAEALEADRELYFTKVRALYDGIIDRLQLQQGSLVEQGDILTSLSDNQVMWVYFNVPEARYLEYMKGRNQHKQDERIELVLADGSKFDQVGEIGAIEANFNNETGNIAFRADFPNPNSLLRHGQTGDILIKRTLANAVVIPQRATFEILDKRYVYVVGEDHVAHQRLIKVQHELEDVYVVDGELGPKDRIILEGVRQVQEGQKVETEYRPPAVALSKLKFHAE